MTVSTNLTVDYNQTFDSHLQAIRLAFQSYKSTNLHDKPDLLELITSYVLSRVQALPNPAPSSFRMRDVNIIYPSGSEADLAVKQSAFTTGLENQILQRVSLEKYLPIDALPTLKPEYLAYGANYVAKVFSQNGVFPQCIVWGYVIHTLLKEIMPNEVESWKKMFLFLKMCCLEGSKNVHPSEPVYVTLRSKALTDFVALIKRVAIKFSEEPNNPKIKALGCLILSFRELITSDVAAFSQKLGFSTQEDYAKILDLVSFVHDVSYHPQYAHLKIHLNWVEILPKRKINYFSFTWLPKIVSTFSALRFALIQKEFLLLMHKEGLECKYIEPNTGKLATTSSSRVRFNNDSIAVEGAKLFLFAVDGFYEGLFMPLYSDFAYLNRVNRDVLPTICRKASETHSLLRKPLLIDRETLQSIRGVSQSIPESLSLSKDLMDLFTLMKENLENAPQELFTFLREEGKFNFFAACKKGDAFYVYSTLEYSIKNFDGILSKLYDFRKKNLTIFEEFLNRYDLTFLEKKGHLLVEVAEEIHLRSAKKILGLVDLIHAVAELQGPFSPFFNKDPHKDSLPLLHFIAFSGAQKSLSKVIQQKREALKLKTQSPLPPPLSSSSSSSSSSSFSPSAPPVVQETTTVKKEKKKTRSAVPSLSSAAPAKTEGKKEAAVEADETFITPKKMGELIKKLKSMGFVFLREGGNHTVMAPREDSKRGQVQLSRGSHGDLVPTGTAHATIRRAYKILSKQPK